MIQFSKLTTNLKVKDIRATVQYYQKYLGFQLVMAVPESQDAVEFSLRNECHYVYALLQRDAVEVMIQHADTFHFLSGNANENIGTDTVVLYCDVVNIQELHQQLVQTDIEITPLQNTWYGMKEFYIRDHNGYLLGFAEKI